MTLSALIAGACAIGLALCWAHARRDDNVWGNRWGDPDHRIVPDELEGPG